ncbi:SOS response-associated peptidase family protein [Mesorhizobium sp. XAP10]|uniref:SOS response-associated peptidase n=1 Tax=unclassified Mesorhizobium TaxID=325217 RepID=UPI0023DFE72C|nr:MULTISPECIES: SOS response-associated peptidase family protein [unclassified Mesorhizobium]MDF3156590.1 SOS response-associated peptidase family protein [Mesorhizobium sp. XAP10]MDF3249507.1 SOS response-associated peptidase family protein [Mesorhizobium sp. XAP4]
MCNDYEQHIAWAEYCRVMQLLALDIPTYQTELDLPQADDIRISDPAPIMRAAGDTIELTRMTFAFPPSGPKGGPIFNIRSEGRNFSNSKRCLIPASAFFEFTGKKSPKAKHRFTLNGAIAGLWRDGEGNKPPTFAMLTTEPGLDVAPIHNRQIVVLRPDDWAAWIHLTKPEVELLKALPAGSLAVETVRQGSD